AQQYPLPARVPGYQIKLTITVKVPNFDRKYWLDHCDACWRLQCAVAVPKHDPESVIRRQATSRVRDSHVQFPVVVEIADCDRHGNKSHWEVRRTMQGTVAIPRQDRDACASSVPRN